jgi:hypothetical protein
MTKNDKQERALRGFMGVQIALAKEDAKRMPTTPEIERAAQALYTSIRRRMAEIRYAENARFPVQVLGNEIRPEILAMSRIEVIVRLCELRALHPKLQYAHREGEALSDRDLRVLLEDAMKLVEGMS